MRLSLPERVPIQKMFIFAACVAGIEQYQGTNFLFSLLFFGFIMASAVAFNLAGGFSRVVGAYIFWFALLVPGFGVVWKSVLGEPADSNLRAPLLTISAYMVSMVVLALVAILTAKIDLRRVGFSATAPKVDYTLAGMGCLAFWVLLSFANEFFGGIIPGFFSALRQIDIFRPLAIVLSTIGVIRATKGRRSVNVVTMLAMFSLIWDGLLGASKQMMMTPLVCWMVAATYMKLRLNFSRTLCIGLGALVSFTIFSQLSQARDLMTDNYSYDDRVAVVFYELTHYNAVVAHNKEAEVEDLTQLSHHYYDSNQNSLVGRLSMISPDDAFFNYALTAPNTGLESVWITFQNLVPNFMLSKKKVGLGAGNIYAHEIGGYLAPDDDSTGISFSPIPEAYHLIGWAGIVFLMPAIWLLLFFSIDFVCGDLKNAPWALMVIVYFAHAAPESLISGLIYYMGYGNFGMLVSILFCTRLAPVFGALFYGSSGSATAPSAVARASRPPDLTQTALP
jgi:hypothetical protein